MGEQDTKENQAKPEEKDEQQKKDQPQKPPKTPLYKKPAFIITASVVLLLLIAGGIVMWLILRQYASTDDAYIDGHVVQISPQVPAQVIALHIDDNQLVHKGDLLLELDPTDYNVALQQAKAQISQAKGRLEQARAQVDSAKAAKLEAVAQEHSAEASLQNAKNDWRRYQNVDARARSEQQLDNAGTALTNNSSRLEEAQAQYASADAGIATAQASVKAAEGDLMTAEAGAKRAEVNLSYCQIRSPCDGRVTERTVEAGNYVTAGQALFLLVDPNVWVTANFKETQLTHMQPGQETTMSVDAFPGLKFHGRVDSIQAGSGSRFSVLPAENATGNFVKIVQRVPVKIRFDRDVNTNNTAVLSPGMSVIPRVKVR